MAKKNITRIVIVAISVLFFSFKAGDIRAQFTGDENFYFQSVKGMLDTGDWLTPRYYGKVRLQKPILFYWLVALSFKIFGIDWYGARFPSILLGALTVLLCYLIGEELFKKKALSLLSAFILATTFKFFKYARFAIPDMTLLFFITLSFYIFMKLFKENRLSLWILFFLSLSLATLTKGPIGVIIPVLSIAIFILFSKEVIDIKRGHIFLGVLLYFFMILPWFLIMLKLHGKIFISELWSREIAHRVGYYSDTKEGVTFFIEYIKTLFFYIPIVFIRFLPWSIFLPKGIFNSISLARLDKEKRGYILLLSWFFSVFIFFTLIGEKHSQYMLALSVPFSLMVGTNFTHVSEFSKKRLIVPIVLILIAAFSFLYFLSNEEFRLNSAVMGGFATRILSCGLNKDDRVGMGSHELIPQQLEVYLDREVEKLGIRWYDPYESDQLNRSRLEYFFRPEGRAFCIISKEDFMRHISGEFKDRLKVIYKDFLWKRKIRLSKETLALLFNGKMGPFLNSFKEEHYLVTNK